VDSTGYVFADEVERVAATLMILVVKPVGHKNKGNQNRKREACLSYP